MKRNKKEVQPYWRPNFVNPAGLPDIKVIRTDFIINFFAVVLMLLVGFYVLRQEYRTYALGKTITGMQQQIRVSEADDAMHLRLSEKFRDAAASVAELEKFYVSPMLAHEFLAEVSAMRPDDLVFKQVSVTEAPMRKAAGSVVVYRVNISGNTRSLPVLDAFKGALSSWETLNIDGYALDIDEALQGRDAETGLFPYSLEISLKPAKTDDASKAEGKDS
ncbi:MAG: hypothetical protein ACPGIC_00535 [Opitutales bacterium]